MTFEDPRQLFKCSRSDCEHDRAGGTPLCARHLREQEVAAGATSIVEPELEARLRNVRTEDDEHPGQKKIWHDDGTSEWVDDPDYQPPGRLYVGPDPDTVHDSGFDLRRTWSQHAGIDPPDRPDPAEMEPHWDAHTKQWVLRPKRRDVDLDKVRKLVAELVAELGL